MTTPTRGRPPKVTDAQMVEYLSHRPGATVEDIRTHFRCKSYTTIANRLTLLVRRGILWRNRTQRAIQERNATPPYGYYAEAVTP